jgi:hypothetical protein
MQVDYAAQMGAQAAYVTCASGPLPAMSNCTNLNNAVSTAIQSTSLGNGVSLTSSPSSPSEAYYCVLNNTLQSVATYPSSPSPNDCSAYGQSSVTPGDYIEIDVNYSYSPTFPGLSLASARTLNGKSMERLK